MTKPHIHRWNGRWTVKYIGRAFPAYFEAHRWCEQMNGYEF